MAGGMIASRAIMMIICGLVVASVSPTAAEEWPDPAGSGPAFSGQEMKEMVARDLLVFVLTWRHHGNSSNRILCTRVASELEHGACQAEAPERRDTVLQVEGSDFAALGAILREQNAYFDDERGIVLTRWESPDPS